MHPHLHRASLIGFKAALPRPSGLIDRLQSPGRGIAPGLAFPDELSTSGQQSLLELASAERLALTKSDVPEVVTRCTAPVSSKGLKVSLVYEPPLLHGIQAVQPY